MDAPPLQRDIECLSIIHYTIQSEELLGDSSGVEPPVPIPNTEVKRSSADDT